MGGGGIGEGEGAAGGGGFTRAHRPSSRALGGFGAFGGRGEGVAGGGGFTGAAFARATKLLKSLCNSLVKVLICK